MKEISIRVAATHTTPNPTVNYCNYIPVIEISAKLEEGEALIPHIKYLRSIVDAEVMEAANNYRLKAIEAYKEANPESTRFKD